MKIRTLILCAAIALFAVEAPSSAAAGISPDKTKKENVQKKADVKVVAFTTNMTCHNCVKKMNENLQFLRGVKDLDVSLENQLITIKYDPSKTDETTLANAIKKLGYKAEKVEAE